MSVRFVNIDRETPMLLPVDMRDLLPEDHLVYTGRGRHDGDGHFKGKQTGNRQRAIPAADDAGPAGILLRDRTVWIPHDRNGNIYGRLWRRAFQPGNRLSNAGFMVFIPIVPASMPYKLSVIFLAINTLKLLDMGIPRISLKGKRYLLSMGFGRYLEKIMTI